MACIKKRQHIVGLAGASRCILDKQRCSMQPSEEGHHTAAIVSNTDGLPLTWGKRDMQQSQVID